MAGQAGPETSPSNCTGVGASWIEGVISTRHRDGREMSDFLKASPSLSYLGPFSWAVGGQGADLLETRVWDALSDRVASYSASRSFRTAAI